MKMMKKTEKQTSSDEETVEGSSSAKKTDEESDTGEIKEEDWIECIQRRTATASERMEAATIPCWIETHRRMI